MQELLLPAEALDEIWERAEAEDDEVCGAILRGQHRPMRNVAVRPSVAYALDPAEQLRLWQEWGGQGDLVLYHSHPSSGSIELSGADREMVLRMPGVAFLVVTERPFLYACRAVAGEVVPLGVRTTGE